MLGPSSLREEGIREGKENGPFHPWKSRGVSGAIKVTPSTEPVPSVAIVCITRVAEYVIRGEDLPLRRFVRIVKRSIWVNLTRSLWSGTNTTSKVNCENAVSASMV